MKKHTSACRSAYALIIVLAAITLCALMMVILLERGTVGLKSAAAYSHADRVRALSDMVQNLVQAQIHDATTLNQKTDVALDLRSTWASQPGAIHVFTPTGDLQKIYKLYSSDALTTTSPDLSQDVVAQWYMRPSEYTDLNDPIDDGLTLHYPILHPDAATLNPGATGIAGGFSIDAGELQQPNGNAAPMPVRWIYLLQDGTLCQLGDGRIKKDNPIVGRLAFWTDDETCKVNINTASPVTAAAFWDIPRTRSGSEFSSFSLTQPAQNEYQRYPGHPAMVSLRPILGTLGNMSSGDYFSLTPKYYWGGSEEGAKPLSQPRTSLLQLKEDRSYTSVDELLFRSHAPMLRSTPSPAQVSGLHFFLSASSRAPELNLFGQPRITIWPLHEEDSETRRTPYDQLIGFCSTLGGKAYHFTRADPLSPTYDYAEITRNQEIFDYLQRLTAVPVPGFPGRETFLTKYSADRDQILTEIFDYIRIVNLNETYQGRHADFASYTSDWVVETWNNAQTASSADTHYPVDGAQRGAGLVVPIEIGSNRGMGRFPVIAEAGLMFINHSQKKPVNGVPLAPHAENPEQLEAMLVIETVTPAFGYMPWIGKDLRFRLKSSNLTFGVGTRVIEMFPDSIFPDPSNKYSHSLPVHYPPALRGGATPGGYDGAGYVAGMNRITISGNAGGTPPTYRFFSPPLDLVRHAPLIAGDDTHFSVSAGTIELEIVLGTNVVQTYTFNFPAIASLPIPPRNDLDHSVLNYNQEKPYGRPWWGARFFGGIQGPLDGDVLQSVELLHGDARIVAGRKVVPASFFSPHANYGSGSFAHGMRSTNIMGSLWNGATAGTYVDLPLADNVVPTLSAPWTSVYTGNRSSIQPKIPSGISSLTDSGWSGDFDNGIGRFVDGPFINKPDEGMMDTSSGITGTYSPYNDWRWSLADGLFSPLRQIPSAVMFGSLPTGVQAGVPWRTLLFCPNPANPSHIGFSDPADYLLLDLFRMPVIEPYAISGPASTDGKINMNYAIVPFSYIRRASSWYALLEPMKIFSIPDSASDDYKSAGTTPPTSARYRNLIDIPETLRQFETRFAAKDIFRSAAEICSLFLVPQGSSLDEVSNLDTGYWSTHRLTGDNSRERLYAELYPKLTTQSNTYRIHLRVQVLPPSISVPSGADDFQPLAEYRGSRLVERYLDPENRALTSIDPDVNSLNALYQYRVLETRQFNP